MIPGVDSGQGLFVGLDGVGQLAHEVAAIRGGQLLPRRVAQGLVRGLDGGVDILGSCGLDGGDVLLRA